MDNIINHLILRLYNFLRNHCGELTTQRMDEEDSFHYFSQKNFLDQQQDNIMKEQTPQDQSNSFISSPQHISQQNQKAPQFKAFNPIQASKNLPEKQRSLYLKMMDTKKYYPGLLHIFQQEQEYQVPQFMEHLNSSGIYKQEDIQGLFLNELFQPTSHNETQKIAETDEILKYKFNEINEKTYENIHLHKCVNINFFQRFDNFVYLHGQQNFLKDFQISLINQVNQAKKIKGPSINLIIQLYEFWMKMFKSFISEIFKYNQKYTLSFIKKKMGAESNSNIQNSSNFDGRSGNSSKISQFDKRRPWKISQIETLEKLISNDAIFSTAMINRLSEELNRSSASISCKLQKMIKDRKNQNPDFIIEQGCTLFDKVYTILKNYPEGLSRQSVNDRLKQHYEMGEDDGWTKSVAQMLSSRSQFVKIKGVYSLDGYFQFDLNKKTFKDKVVNCLLKCPNGKGDLKYLIEIYITLYGQSEGLSILSQQRKKQLEASFSKALSRYNIFNKSESKTIYKLKQFCEPKDYNSQIQSYFS